MLSSSVDSVLVVLLLINDLLNQMQVLFQPSKQQSYVWWYVHRLTGFLRGQVKRTDVFWATQKPARLHRVADRKLHSRGTRDRSVEFPDQPSSAAAAATTDRLINPNFTVNFARFFPKDFVTFMNEIDTVQMTNNIFAIFSTNKFLAETAPKAETSQTFRNQLTTSP